MVQLWSYAYLSTCGTYYPIRTLGAPASSFGIDTRHRQCSDDPPYHSTLQTRPASPDAPPSPAARSPIRALCIAFHFASSRSSQIWEPLCWLLDLSSSAAAAASSIESVSVRRPLPSASACEGYCGHARGITAMLGGIIPIADYSSPLVLHLPRTRAYHASPAAPLYPAARSPTRARNVVLRFASSHTN